VIHCTNASILRREPLDKLGILKEKKKKKRERERERERENVE